MMDRAFNSIDPVGSSSVSSALVWYRYNYESLVSTSPAFLQTLSWLAQFVRGCVSRSTMCWSSVQLSFSFPVIWPLGMKVLGIGAEMGPWMQHGGPTSIASLPPTSNARGKKLRQMKIKVKSPQRGKNSKSMLKCGLEAIILQVRVIQAAAIGRQLYHNIWCLHLR